MAQRSSQCAAVLLTLLVLKVKENFGVVICIFITAYLLPLLCVAAAENLKVCAPVDGDRPSAAESLEAAVGPEHPAAAAPAALHPPRKPGTQTAAQ